MKKEFIIHYLTIIITRFSSSAFAANAIKKVAPAFWWAGMKNPDYKG